MRTICRVSTLADLLDKIQSELGRTQIDVAQRLAAEMAEQLEAWRFDLLHIPPEERNRYQAPNGYWYPEIRRWAETGHQKLRSGRSRNANICD